MPRVAGDGTFEAYVYANDHNPPHFHLYWDGGDGEAVIDLRTLQVLAGDEPKKQGIDFVIDQLASIREAWNRLNPDEPLT